MIETISWAQVIHKVSAEHLNVVGLNSMTWRPVIITEDVFNKRPNVDNHSFVCLLLANSRPTIVSPITAKRQAFVSRLPILLCIRNQALRIAGILTKVHKILSNNNSFSYIVYIFESNICFVNRFIDKQIVRIKSIWNSVVSLKNFIMKFCTRFAFSFTTTFLSSFSGSSSSSSVSSESSESSESWVPSESWESSSSSSSSCLSSLSSVMTSICLTSVSSETFFAVFPIF